MEEGVPPGSIQDFLAFLRSASVPAEQVRPFQKVAEQLLLALSAPDLLSISPGEMDAWRESLRVRNPTEAQLALIARGLSAIQAFQRRRSAVPAAGASPQPKPPLRGPRKWLTIAVLAGVVAASIAYTVRASREAVLENPDDLADLEQTNARRRTGFFYAGYTYSVHQPAGSCSAAVLGDVNRAAVMGKQGSVREAEKILEGALERDPRCVGAARVLTALAQGRFTRMVELRKRFEAAAEREPESAAAQLNAAFAARVLGEGFRYKKYLDRATADDPTQPLLDSAWASYWDIFARPRDFQKEVAARRREVARTGDPSMLRDLAAIYEHVGDWESAAEVCQRYFTVAPDDDDFMHSRTCLAVSVVRGDAEGEVRYLKRLLAAKVPEDESQACLHAEVAAIYLKHSCRSDDVLREAKLAIEGGCGALAEGPWRSALVTAKRYEEASGQLSEGPEAHPKTGRTGGAFNRRLPFTAQTALGMALIMANQDQAALASLKTAAGLHDELAQILFAMLEAGVARERLSERPICKPVGSRADRLAGAAPGYLRYEMFDEARGLIDQALALDSRSGTAWAAKINLLSLERKAKEAVKTGEEALAAGIDGAAVAGKLGYAYQQLCQCEKAIPLFQREIAADPWTPSSYSNLARCLETAGRADEAKATWKYVLSGRPRVYWWFVALLAGLVVALYLVVKVVLVALMPDRFGHLKFP